MHSTPYNCLGTLNLMYFLRFVLTIRSLRLQVMRLHAPLSLSPSLPLSLPSLPPSLPRIAIAVLQRNVRKYLFLRDWKWWRLYTKVKPLLNVARTEDELRQKEEELNKLREKMVKEEQSRKEMEELQTELIQEKNQLFIQLQRVSMEGNSI